LDDRRRPVRASRPVDRPWLRSDRALPRLVLRPLERYLQREAGSASLLMAAAAVALIWANAWPESYDRVWSTIVSVDLGPLLIEEDVRHWINDLLMAVFFYVVALEVKRELIFGSLRDRRSAAVPTAAAFGTIVGAALTYLAVNLIGDGDLRGWAIPIATDIAFAVGVLGLAGGRAPRELRAFMLTLAVVDDLGTIVVIGLVFSTGVSLAWLVAAAALVAAVAVAQRIGIRALVLYVLLASLLWVAVFKSGVHATIAGVVLGFLTPAVAFHSRQRTSEFLGARLSEIAGSDREVSEGTLLETSRLAQEAVSPLARMEERLHPWSAYAILPLFALANAGVPLSFDGIGEAFRSPVGLGVALGLVVGAPLGGVLFAWAIVRFGPGRMPEGLDWPAIGAVTPLKGIGFTIAIFITALAFDEVELQEQAKLAILVASAAAAVIGLGALYVRAALLRRRAGAQPGSRSRGS
jgi:NhaA family Na+:H+ antiporter